MDFNDYQLKARGTAFYPNLGENLWYPALKLNGEAGEVAEVVGKAYRDSGTVYLKNIKNFNEVKEKLIKELGDVLWYIAAVCEELGIEMNLVANANLEKLRDRADRGVLGGSGDER